VPAIYVPQSPSEPSATDLLWHAEAQVAWQVRGWAACHLPHHDPGCRAPRVSGARCPTRRRAASLPARKSQTKSQRRPTSGDAQRRQATVKPGQVPTERHRATSSDARNVTGGQGVAGSNPAVPTGSQTFSNIFTPQEPAKEPTCCAMALLETCVDRVPRVLAGHVPRRQSRRNRQSRGQRSLRHPDLTGGPDNLRTGRRHPRPHRNGKPVTHRTAATAGRGAGVGAQTKPAHAALDATAAGVRTASRTGRHDGRYLHGPPENKAHSQYGESAIPGQQPQCILLTNASSVLS